MSQVDKGAANVPLPVLPFVVFVGDWIAKAFVTTSSRPSQRFDIAHWVDTGLKVAGMFALLHWFLRVTADHPNHRVRNAVAAAFVVSLLGDVLTQLELPVYVGILVFLAAHLLLLSLVGPEIHEETHCRGWCTCARDSLAKFAWYFVVLEAGLVVGFFSGTPIGKSTVTSGMLAVAYLIGSLAPLAVVWVLARAADGCRRRLLRFAFSGLLLLLLADGLLAADATFGRGNVVSGSNQVSRAVEARWQFAVPAIMLYQLGQCVLARSMAELPATDGPVGSSGGAPRASGKA